MANINILVLYQGYLLQSHAQIIRLINTIIIIWLCDSYVNQAFLSFFIVQQNVHHSEHYHLHITNHAMVSSEKHGIPGNSHFKSLKYMIVQSGLIFLGWLASL